MDVVQFVCRVVETNGLFSFLPHFQPDLFLFPFSLPFWPSGSPTLTRVGFLQNPAWFLPSVACALTLSMAQKVKDLSHSRVIGVEQHFCLIKFTNWRTDWLLTWEISEEKSCLLAWRLAKVWTVDWSSHVVNTKTLWMAQMNAYTEAKKHTVASGVLQLLALETGFVCLWEWPSGNTGW